MVCVQPAAVLGGHSLLLGPRGPTWDPEPTPDGSAPADPRASSRFGSLSGTREVKVGSVSPALPPAQVSGKQRGRFGQRQGGAGRNALDL